MKKFTGRYTTNTAKALKGSAPSWPRPRKKPPPCAAICTGQPTRSTS